MNRLEKAVAQLKTKGINAKIENDTVYVYIGDTPLELSNFEIEFQEQEWIDGNEPIEVGDEVITPTPDILMFDLHNFSFVGTVTKIEDGIATVVDSDDDYFDIEVERLTKYID